MSRKAKYQKLLDKSVHAVLSAIEIYNKPDFKYREEIFSILMVNSWELLLKARIIDQKGGLKSIYMPDTSARKKDGEPYKNTKYKKNYTGNYKTINISVAINKLKLPDELSKNIRLLVEIRDNAIHFMNESKLLNKKVLEIGTASLKSYVKCVNDWFSYDLSQYNFYLMPISFFHSHEMESFSINNETEQHKNLLNFIALQEEKHPSDETKEHNISLILETKFAKSKSVATLTNVKYDPEDPNAISYKIDSEDKFKEKYPWNWKDDLLPKLKARYTNFIQNKKFWNLKADFEKDEQFSKARHLDWHNTRGTKKKFYSPNILKEFDKHYIKKQNSTR